MPHLKKSIVRVMLVFRLTNIYELKKRGTQCTKKNNRETKRDKIILVQGQKW